ncbi:hypothetical protein T484DRAFT_1957995 [Baffinella frigidus]|nr:hypothetical protein T484DRAFT_1957995 [Cryptophyta sp. CCMP2293]
MVRSRARWGLFLLTVTTIAMATTLLLARQQVGAEGSAALAAGAGQDSRWGAAGLRREGAPDVLLAAHVKAAGVKRLGMGLKKVSKRQEALAKANRELRLQVARLKAEERKLKARPFVDTHARRHRHGSNSQKQLRGSTVVCSPPYCNGISLPAVLPGDNA